jgi:hypothetical protein
MHFLARHLARAHTPLPFLRDFIMQEPPLLSTDEIRSRLWAIRNIDQRERNARRKPGISTIARQTELSADYLYLLIYGQRVPAPKAQRKLSIALQTIQLPT